MFNRSVNRIFSNGAFPGPFVIAFIKPKHPGAKTLNSNF